MKLSPGKYHAMIPKEPLANLQFRRAILEEAKTNKDFQAGLVEMCRQDILFWINAFVLQYNPLKKIGEDSGPFITWDFQDIAILGGDEMVNGQLVHRWGILECVADQQDARWQKSREIGASWLVLIVIVWLCLFHPGVLALCMSQDKDKVDKRPRKGTLFAKIDYILKHLPDWMTGGFETKLGVGIYRASLEYNFARTGSSISGEATTKASAVGERYTIALIDEFGQFLDGATTFDDTADSCKSRFFVGTHRDTSSMFYALCFDKDHRDMREILTHWSQHPEKRKGLYRVDDGKVTYLDPGYQYDEKFHPVLYDGPTGGPFPWVRSPWYDAEVKRRGAKKRGVQMNLDIDPMGASERFFQPDEINRLIAKACTNPCWVGKIHHDGKGNLIELVEDLRGPLKLWVMPKSSRTMPQIRAAGGQDISTGTGRSPHCLSLCDIATGHKFLEYIVDNVYQPELAEIVCALCRIIRGPREELPMLCWEAQFAQAFQKRLLDDLGYGRGNAFTRDGKNIGINAGDSSFIVGMMDDYRDALYEHRLINPSEHALKEALKMIYEKKSVVYKKAGKENESPSGAGVFHGDIVRADAMMNLVREALASRYHEPDEEEATNIVQERLSFEGRRKHREREELATNWF